ncbi:MAG: 7TM diverse intracellular signaling domain-containing protein [Pseudomonadota bacterium]
MRGPDLKTLVLFLSACLLVTAVSGPWGTPAFPASPVILEPGIDAGAERFKFEPLAHPTPSSLIQLGFGVSYGVILAMALLSLFFFLFLGDRTHLWYFLTLTALVLFTLMSNDQRISWHLSGRRPWEWEPLYRVVVIALMGLITQFSRSFLMSARMAPLVDQGLLAFLWFALSLWPLSLFAESLVYSWLFPFLGFVSPAIFIGAGIACLRRGFRPARFFTLGAPFFTLGGLAELMAGRGLIPSTAVTQNGIQIGTAIMVMMFSLAQVDRMRALGREKEAAETAFRESELRFQALFDQTFQYMWLLDPSGRIREINATALAGETLEKPLLAGRFFPALDFWKESPESRSQLDPAVKKAGAGEFVRLEVEGVGPEGRRRDLDVSLKPVTAPDDRVVLIIAEGRDITELKFAQEQMFQAEKLAALGRLAAGVAHEINNPNNFIYFNIPILRDYMDELRDALEAARSDHGPPLIDGRDRLVFFAEVNELLNDMEHGSARITGIVSEFRDYLRGSESAEKKPVMIDALIGRVLSLTGGQVERMVGRLELDISPDLPPLWVLPGRIEQVLTNLLINAGQAADKKDSWIKITAGRPAGEQEVFIAVEDNGAGIPEDVAAKIFEPFFTTKDEKTGTGQGLAISRKIMEDHGGRISFRSAPGQGACFTLVFPLDYREDR